MVDSSSSALGITISFFLKSLPRQAYAATLVRGSLKILSHNDP